MAEPVSLAQAKAHLEIETAETRWDTLVTALILAAREFVENDTGLALTSRTFVETRDTFGDYIALYRRPVTALTTLEYTDSAGDAQEYESAVTRFADVPARIYPVLNGDWPTLGTNGRVTITYVAGYADNAVPQSLKQAMLLLIGHWFANRENVHTGTGTPTEIPFAVTALLNQYRTPVVA